MNRFLITHKFAIVGMFTSCNILSCTFPLCAQFCADMFPLDKKLKCLFTGIQFENMIESSANVRPTNLLQLLLRHLASENKSLNLVK